MISSISILIQTHNEEQNIGDCIESGRLLTNNILVTDSQSTDNTVLIAKDHGATVIPLPYLSYVEPIRKIGIDKAKTSWVLILDADERISIELASEIKEAISQTPTHYFVPRKNIFGKSKWLKHGGWWPDYQPRLIKKSHLVDWPNEIHSMPVFKGSPGKLINPLLHYSHGNFSHMVEKTTIFENTDADLLLKAGRKVNTLIFFRKFLGELFRRLIKKRGFLDGKIGIIESIYQAYSQTIKYLYLYEKKYRPL